MCKFNERDNEKIKNGKLDRKWFFNYWIMIIIIFWIKKKKFLK